MQTQKHPQKSLQKKLAILGGGSFATAFSRVLAPRHSVFWWMRDAQNIEHIQKTGHNLHYLPQKSIPSSVSLSTNMQDVIEGADLVLLMVPCSAVSSVLDTAILHLKSEQNLVAVMKGLRSNDPIFYSEYIQKRLDESGLCTPLGVLGGPNLASEIADGQTTFSVVASQNDALLNLVSACISTDYFFVQKSKDIKGVELGSALKNIYAIAAGLLDGLSVGENCRGFFFAQAFSEMRNIAVHFGARESTLLGSAILGDFFATCVSVLSRNHRLGMTLASGVSLAQAQMIIGGVAEGYNTMKNIRMLLVDAKLDTPILDALEDVIEKGRPAAHFVDLWAKPLHD